MNSGIIWVHPQSPVHVQRDFLVVGHALEMQIYFCPELSSIVIVSSFICIFVLQVKVAFLNIFLFVYYSYSRAVVRLFYYNVFIVSEGFMGMEFDLRNVGMIPYLFQVAQALKGL